MKPFLVAAVLVAAHAIGAEAVQPCAEMGTYELPVKWRKRTDVSSCARFWASGRAIRIPADSPAVIHGIIDLGVADPGAGGGLVPPRARDVRSLAAARVEVGALALADAPLVGAPLAVDPVPSQQESSGSGAGTAPAWTKTAPPLGAVPPPTPLADPAQLASTFGTNLPTDMKSLPTSLPSDVPPPPAVPMVVAAGEPILLAPSDSAPQVQITQPPAVPVVGVSDGPNPMQLMPTPTNLPPPLVVPAVIVPDGSKMPGQTPAPTSLPPPLPVIPVIVNEPEPIMPSQTPTDLPPRPLATQFPPPILPILEPIITMPANAPSGSLPPPRGTESPREPIPIMPTNAPTPMPLAPTDPLAPILPPPIPIPGATPLPGPIGDGPTPSALPTDSPRPELPFPIPALLPEPMTKPMGAPTDMVQTDMPTPVPRPTPFLPPLLPPSGSEFMLPPTNLPPPPLETKTMPPLPPPGVTGIPIGPTPPPPGAIGSETSFANPLATPIFTAGPGSAPGKFYNVEGRRTSIDTEFIASPR